MILDLIVILTHYPSCSFFFVQNYFMLISIFLSQTASDLEPNIKRKTRLVWRKIKDIEEAEPPLPDAH